MEHGSVPVLDDVKRSNCPQAGIIGHMGRGWCPHDKPRWLCVECLDPTDSLHGCCQCAIWVERKPDFSIICACPYMSERHGHSRGPN
jgi:hypothetical protein